MFDQFDSSEPTSNSRRRWRRFLRSTQSALSRLEEDDRVLVVGHSVPLLESSQRIRRKLCPRHAPNAVHLPFAKPCASVGDQFEAVYLNYMSYNTLVMLLASSFPFAAKEPPPEAAAAAAEGQQPMKKTANLFQRQSD